MKIERNIIAPFCVFFIIMGAGGVIILPTTNALLGFSEKTYNILFDISWAVGALIALIYSLVALKEFLKKSAMEKFLYWFLAVLFIGLLFFPLLR